jgi:arsenate reductase
MQRITIFHNPNCGTSRNVLALIRNSGEEPEVIQYLKTPPSTAKIREILKALNIGARGLLRQKGTPYDEMGLGDPKWSDAELIELMHLHPILINRPVVLSPLGAKLCRPSEAVLEILPSAQRGAFVKEDGQVVRQAGGR